MSSLPVANDSKPSDDAMPVAAAAAVDSVKTGVVSAATAAAATAAAAATGDDSFMEHTPPPYFDPKTSRVPKWLQLWIADVFSFIMIHYNLWAVPVIALFYYLYHSGHGYVALALVAIYIPSFVDGSEYTANGRPWEWLWQMPMWRLSAEILNIKLVREQALDPKKQYIFGFHPHGIIVLSRMAWFGGSWETLFPGIKARLLGATVVFKIPLARELCLWLHGIDASRTTADKALNAGHSIIVYPGGVAEIFTTDPESKVNTLVLGRRFGFVKLAMRHGAELVPTFVFGEKWFYNVWTPPQWVVALARKTIKIPLIIFWGRLLWLPKRLPKHRPYAVVYGKPIATTQVDDPSDEQVRAVHAQYVREVQRLFDQYKQRFGYDADETLVIT